MSVFGNPFDHAGVQAAARMLATLEEQVRARDRKLAAATRRIAELEEQVRALHEDAEEQTRELMGRLDASGPVQAELEEHVADLEEQVAELELDKRILERRLDQVTDELEAELAEHGDDTEEATRQRVLRKQAMRARLAKTDMSPRARLRTLRHAARAGIELDSRQQAELRALRDRYG